MKPGLAHSSQNFQHDRVPRARPSLTQPPIVTQGQKHQRAESPTPGSHHRLCTARRWGACLSREAAASTHRVTWNWGLQRGLGPGQHQDLQAGHSCGGRKDRPEAGVGTPAAHHTPSW